MIVDELDSIISQSTEIASPIWRIGMAKNNEEHNRYLKEGYEPFQVRYSPLNLHEPVWFFRKLCKDKYDF